MTRKPVKFVIKALFCFVLFCFLFCFVLFFVLFCLFLFIIISFFGLDYFSGFTPGDEISPLPIPVKDLKEHYLRMHADNDRLFSEEYKVKKLYIN